LSDADITHTTNEVSFKENCQYNNTLFCAPPEFIETLKASGINLIDLSGNHNNDLGSELNAQTITQYETLGWNFIGGGRNAEEAKLPFITEQKGSKVAFLSYNYPDSTGVLAGANSAGANPFESMDKVTQDIAQAKTTADFVIVTIHYWECYAYPDGYVEFPECDLPIGQQATVFRSIADAGAHMVVGTSAHQPQTYELYNKTPIYYGLGNIFFEQTSWPGTERSIVLTHYFNAGKLLQTKITPTRYDDALQTRLMNEEEANYLLTRLYDAHLKL
jgi:poly-gamma-glutamate synthesis protein (capsule biosynthesis protein)